MNKSFMRAVINREYSLIKALEDLGVVEVGSLVIDRTCYCPFHENTETKAAKIYDDYAGVTLFCFSEQKTFRSSDAIERFSKESIETVFSRIWSNLSEEERTFYTDEFECDNEVITPAWAKALEKLKGFKQGKLTFQNTLDVVMETIKEGQNGKGIKSDEN